MPTYGVNGIAGSVESMLARWQAFAASFSGSAQCSVWSVEYL